MILPPEYSIPLIYLSPFIFENDYRIYFIVRKEILSMSQMAPCEKCWSELCDHLRNDFTVIGLLAKKIRNMSEEDFTKEFSDEQIQGW